MTLKESAAEVNENQAEHPASTAEDMKRWLNEKLEQTPTLLPIKAIAMMRKRFGGSLNHAYILETCNLARETRGLPPVGRGGRPGGQDKRHFGVKRKNPGIFERRALALKLIEQHPEWALKRIQAEVTEKFGRGVSQYWLGPKLAKVRRKLRVRPVRRSAVKVVKVAPRARRSIQAPDIDLDKVVSDVGKAMRGLGIKSLTISLDGEEVSWSSTVVTTVQRSGSVRV